MTREILIVDDEADIRTLLAGILEDEGFETREAANSTEALESVGARRPSLVLLDIWLQGSEMDGLQILETLRADHTDLPVIMMSGHGTIETAVSALKTGAYDFIEKPFKTDRMMLIIERALEADRLRRENAELKLRVAGDIDLIGSSPAITQLRQSIDKVAPTNSRVLISGPAGSGKEVAARLIHIRSHRADAPFVVLNCASMTPERVEEELFGVAGNETGEGGGAHKTGTFERAHMGTLFLDEVAEMPTETQAKIVRVLQDQTFYRLGGKTPIKVDARVIAATTRNLSEEMAAGKFREDLYYRLSVVPIAVPAL
ncbi:MAG: sigma-54 dependent transcriptional regulator, partial [Rhodospirillales bacterium]|nr:sigma-54 dependent transcriptional regulator [Rhodospirillales bacterium]